MKEYLLQGMRFRASNERLCPILGLIVVDLISTEDVPENFVFSTVNVPKSILKQPLENVIELTKERFLTRFDFPLSA